MARFLRILVAITALVHVPVALGVTEAASRLGLPKPPLIGWAWATAGVLLFIGRARAGMPDHRRNRALTALVDIPYFIHWCAAVWALIPSVVLTVVALAAGVILGEKLQLPASALMYSYFSGLAICSYGVLLRRRWFRVVERELGVPGLDARFDGFRIAHLSDLHIGTLTPRAWGLKWSRAANRKAPDLAVVTGDLITSGADFHGDVADVVGELRAPCGVFASMGNHDYFGSDEPLVSMLASRKVRVLRNQGTLVTREGAKLWLAAVDDTWSRRDDLAAALRERPAGTTTILLAHDPKTFDDAAEAGVELVLGGHTHGGQVALPFLYRTVNAARLAYRYSVGVYRRGKSILYVHPGLGTTGPPIRLGVAPEVTILVLRAVA
jgi:predicted MPP superfamily phosphohydrolase